MVVQMSQPVPSELSIHVDMSSSYKNASAAVRPLLGCPVVVILGSSKSGIQTYEVEQSVFRTNMHPTTFQRLH
jgi:hypothetical protein